MLWFLFACSTVAPVPEGTQLAPCPSSPNCVSTMADPADAQHYHPSAPAPSVDIVVQAIEALPGCVLEHRADDQLRAACSTPSGLFTDDLHVVVRDGTLHARSSSRMGYGDLGVNRARVEALYAAVATGTTAE